jgi:hypothetical protein
MAIQQEDVLQAQGALAELEGVETELDAISLLGSSAGGYPVSLQFVSFMKEYFQFIVDQWNAGNHLTEPHFLYGVDKINPHPRARFTKPILVLINSLDFSGGDFFPAILQDNKRITLMGGRTSGAGGYVHQATFPNLMGLQGFNFTGSIAQRVDLNPIENLGVKPEVPYTLTVQDVQDGYQDYAKAIVENISKLVP